MYVTSKCSCKFCVRSSRLVQENEDDTAVSPKEDFAANDNMVKKSYLVD